MQEIGLLGLRLDDRREYRLHVWDPSSGVGEPPVHDHPFDFTSTIVVGDMTNTHYEEDPTGVEYCRVRYRPSNEGARTSDTVRLSRRCDHLHCRRGATPSWPTSCTTAGSSPARSPSSGWPSSTLPR